MKTWMVTYTMADGAVDHILTVSLSRSSGNAAQGASGGVVSMVASVDCVVGENCDEPAGDGA